MVSLERLEKLKLTPNQYYLAYFIHKKDKDGFNRLKNLYRKDLYFKEDIYILVFKNYLNPGTEDKYKIVFDSSSINEIFDNEAEGYGTIEDVENEEQGIKLEDNVSGEKEVQVSDWDTFVSNFRSLFPSGVTTGGYYVRSSSSDCSKKLMIFMKEHPQHSRDIILKATKAYIDRYKLQGYKYIKTAAYFISKDKSSVLSAECEILGDDDRRAPSLFNDGI